MVPFDTQPGAMHAGFAQFAAFDQDAIDNGVFVAKGKLTMAVLAVGGEKAFGSTMAVVMRAAATDVPMCRNSSSPIQGIG